MTRLLDLWGPELAALKGTALVDAIRAAEGRTVMAEIVAGAPALLGETSNPELAAGFGADLICLNMVDPAAAGPLAPGLDALDPPVEGFAGLASLLGRPVGLNLEPDLPSVPARFRGTEETAGEAERAGAAFVMVTANPGRGATVGDLSEVVGTVRRAAPGLLCLAGKMHMAGAEERLGAKVAEQLVKAGAQGVLVPVPGTVPGVDEGVARAMVVAAQDAGALAVGTIGTSQEGADEATIRSLALAAKRIGVDVHHVGDGGLTGIAVPQNVYTYSVAIRGIRHTWTRMARGVRSSWGTERTGGR
jgi:hypothetical protein